MSNYLTDYELHCKYAKVSNRFLIIISSQFTTDDSDKIYDEMLSLEKYCGSSKSLESIKTPVVIEFNTEHEMRSYYNNKFSDYNPDANTFDNPKEGMPRIYAMMINNNGDCIGENS